MPRVLLVTRRFWPLAGDSIWRILNLAAGLRSAGWSVDVLTAAWHSSWPTEVQLREFNVHRIGPSPSTPFRARRYVRALSNWIAKRHAEIDCVIVDGSDDDALAVATHNSHHLPIVVRYDSSDTLGTSFGPLAQRAVQRALAAARLATRVIAPHQHAQRELVAGDVRSDNIVVIPDGPGESAPRDAQTRAAARRALADINHELFLRADDRLCICLADLVTNSNIEFLVRTIGPICENRRDLRCWIVGDGPLRSRVMDLLKTEGWRHDILLPGSFEAPDVVMAAADLCLLPSSTQGQTWIWPTAIASGLTTLTADSPSLRSRLGTAVDDLVYPHGDSPALAEKLERWCRRSELFQDAMRRAAELVSADRRSLDQWQSLVGSVAKHPSRS